MRAVIEPAVGIPNGVRTVFRALASYLPGSLRAFVNGLLMRREPEDGGGTELGNRKIQTKLVLESSDVLQLYYLPIY